MPPSDPNLGKMIILTPQPIGQQYIDINENFITLASFIELLEDHVANVSNPHDVHIHDVLDTDNNALGFLIKNIGAGVDDGDAVNKKQLEDKINEIEESQNKNLSDLEDVDITDVSNAQLIVYDSSKKEWVNVSFSGDATIDEDGVVTIKSEFVTNDEMTAFVATEIDAVNDTINNLPASGGVDSSTIKTVTSAVAADTYTVTTNDRIILVDATLTPAIITLPLASASAGLLLHIKKIDSTGNAVTITPTVTTPVDTIDGASTNAITVQYVTVSLTSDGNDWFVL